MKKYFILATLLFITGCSVKEVQKSHYNIDGVKYRVVDVQRGIASYYSGRFHGRRMASGEIFNQYALTAAHKTLPFGTKVRVTFLSTGDSVVVKINDRGPHVAGRIIDLSYEAAKSIGMVPYGLGRVKLEVLK